MLTTNNRGEFNRSYKRYLENTGKIRCAYCRYNRGENDTRNWYGGSVNGETGKYEFKKFPSWKLTSKKPKQWMGKGIKYTFFRGKFGTSIDLEF